MTSVRAVLAMMDTSTMALEALKRPQDLSVIEVLDRYFDKIPLDTKLGKALYRYQVGYISTSKDYVEFFGSNLLGVHVIRFREVDVLRFYNEVIEIDYDALKNDIRQTKIINHTYKVSGDIFNLTLIYMLHRALADKKLPEEDRIWMARNIALIFFYRATAALLSAYFKYPSDPKIAQAAYAELSSKYLIKKLGSWHKVMEYRANELISKSGTQYKKLVKMDDDLDLVDVINDGANSIKDMIKNYYSEFARVHAQGDNIGVTQSTGLDVQGKEVVRDRIRNVDKSIALIRQYVTDSRSFVRDDFIRVIIDLNKNTSVRLLKETLTWISGNTANKDYKLIDETLTSIVTYSHFLIQTKMESSRTNDMFYVLTQLKNLYLSSRSSDADLIHIRQLTDEMMKKIHKKLSTSLLLATRTALLLYVTLLVLAGQKSN